ncbi:hypothetical protein DPMN_104335 [Dreissena polymorpha]|uniref:Cadherin domain-containing protein n=1 Tax=Dreissena polymorpha TaxID=45954 RepID=A0A9D4HCW9_DREPO|nr:hypothetical protein DPMN_104335 [Dreissena polymorpha]
MGDISREVDTLLTAVCLRESFTTHNDDDCKSSPTNSSVVKATSLLPIGATVTDISDFAELTGTICTSQVLDRETATHYWLTVYAQDHGLVPLHSRLEVYIEVTDVNDHIPLTFEPVYYGTVVENANNDFVTQIQAFDLDRNLNQSLKYAITRFDPLEFFQIHPDTGMLVFG